MKKNVFLLFAIFQVLAFPIRAEIIYSESRSKNCIALTFDDGPSPEITPRILEILAKYKAKATFFVTGENAQCFPHILRMAAKQGHEIGNHTFSHPRLTRLNKENVLFQLKTTQQIIAKLSGFAACIFRPPYGDRNSAVVSVANYLGLKTILWSNDPQDWKDPSPETISRRVLLPAKAGDIVVMHDTHANTALALPRILHGLREKNLQPVTVGELLVK